MKLSNKRNAGGIHTAAVTSRDSAHLRARTASRLYFLATLMKDVSMGSEVFHVGELDIVMSQR